MKKFFVLTALAAALLLGIVHESEAGLFGRLRARRGGGCSAPASGCSSCGLR